MQNCARIIAIPIVLGAWTVAIGQRPGPGGPGFGGPGGPPMQEEIKLLKKYDDNGDGWLNREERDAARKELANRPRRGPRGFGPPGDRGPQRDREPREVQAGNNDRPRDDARSLPAGGEGLRTDGRPGPLGGPPPFGRMNREPPKPGPRIAPGDVKSYTGKPLYDTSVLRTLFIDFEDKDWEAELADFKETDVEVPATLTVDGKLYPNVGVKFRGMSSFMMIPEGFKRSLNSSLDFIDADQRLEGYKSLNLLNCNGDPSMMSTLLYSAIAGKHIPAPKVNFVQVVINGEYWGIYANAQQIDKLFVKENFDSEKGTRWKVPGSPGGDGGLRYLGDDLDAYKPHYEMKSNDGKKAWQALVELCRVLKETPDERLEAELSPILDIDEALWFLAVDNALVNSDGYWTRASDYYLFRDVKGVFHVIPSDMNEAFHSGGPPGSRGGFGPPPGFGPPDGFGPPPGFSPPDGSGPPSDLGPPEDRDRPARDQQRSPDERSGDERRGGRRMGRGGPGGMMHGGVDLDPLIGLDNERMPLRGRLLKLPHLREKYLAHVREIADESLDWKWLGPIVAEQRSLIEEAVAQDTRKLGTTEAFLTATAPDAVASSTLGENQRHGGSLRDFADKRREYLLKYRQPEEPPSRGN